MKGLVLGVYTESLKEGNGNVISSFTKAFEDVDKRYKNKLLRILKETGPFFKSLAHRTLWISPLKETGMEFDCIAIINLGSKNAKVNPMEDRDENAENIRCSIADGLKTLQNSGDFDEIFLDPCDYPKCVGEAAALTLFAYEGLKSKRKPKPSINLYEFKNIEKKTIEEYQRGLVFGECQNFARLLTETPANLMTPSIFSMAVENIQNGKNVNVIIRDKSWIELMKMGSFLSVASGSSIEPVFLELHYSGDPDSTKCIALVGKGVTFDSGGISLKPCNDMDKMRGDMGGAACVASVFLAASSLKFKINIKGFIPLTENMFGGNATKPGDVVTAMNGKTIQVDDTDAEGRLILADALCYAQQFKPIAILDIATLTGSITAALSAACSGVFSNDDKLWDLFHEAGKVSGDRVWRMPLFKHFTEMMTNAKLADINNFDTQKVGDPCSAAAFLQEFVNPGIKWIHNDIYGVMQKNEYYAPYLSKGMTGRPTRTIIQFLETLSEDISMLD